MHIKKEMKHEQRICVWGLCFMILFLLPGNSLAGNPNSLKLQDKMADISSLRTRLMEIKAEAFRLREQLKGHMTELEREIRKEKKGSRVISYQAAIRNPRIHFNIKLIQKISAYISGLNKKIRYVGIGNDELEFLYQQADDDLKICETLNDMKIEKLIDHVDQTFRKYETEANRLLLNVDDIVMVTEEQIWNESMKRK